jgi:hypothetical protein
VIFGHNGCKALPPLLIAFLLPQLLPLAALAWLLR